MTTIDILPDEVLLAIFDSWVDEDVLEKKEVEAWQLLVHVCRRWRSVVFGSPRRLNLRLVCGAKTPASDTLDVWPSFPLVIRHSDCGQGHNLDNIITVLGRSDRVCQIDLSGLGPPSTENVLAVMQQTFPELTDLRLEGMPTAVPDSFLGGSAPRLRKLWLGRIMSPFPGLPKLLLSASHLVELQLCDIQYPKSFSLKAMVTALSTLTSLRFLSLKARFVYSEFHPNRESRRLPPTRSLLPVLGTLRFAGVSKYFDDLVVHIDAPRLNNLDIILFKQNALDTPQFIQFTNCIPMLEALKKAHVAFQVDGAGVKLSSQSSSGHGELKVKIPGRTFKLNEQLLSLQRVFTLCLPPLSMSEDLYIYENTDPQPDWPDDVENTLWLELLHPFPAVKNLYLSKEIASCIAPALQELIGGTATEVLPILQNIFLELWPVPGGIEQFIAARQLSGRPIAVSTIPLWERDLMRSWVMEFNY